jgi:hypothetical protein
MMGVQPPPAADQTESENRRERFHNNAQIGSHADRRADRRARYARRQMSGRIVLAVEVSEHKLASALMAAGRLTPNQAMHRGNLQAAVAAVIADFVERWSV